jgi:hypothetical protein
MKVVEGNFGKDKEEPISASEFLSLFAVKAMQYEEEGKEIDCAVIMYDKGEMYEIASSRPYPEGVYFLLQKVSLKIIEENWEN